MPPRPRTLLLLLLLLVIVFDASLRASESIGDGGQVRHGSISVYIVYLGHLPSTDTSDEREADGFSAVEFAHHDLLNEVLDDCSSASDRIVRSYKRSLNGFAAKLSEEEAQKLSGMNGVVSVFPSRTLDLLTTRSWDFLGLPQTPKELPLQGEVIIGMFDTGVWPDSPSFSDDGFGPPPSRWKGVCQNFTCNNKIIGARAYNDEGATTSNLSALDDNGHGSHTASIVAGQVVANVSFDGLAAGITRGAVPGARLAIYKVCSSANKDDYCSDAAILAAFDDAIADGVDVISASLGTLFVTEYFKDTMAIGSFHAMRHGVFTSAPAGNEGFALHVSNVAPWMLSVAASSIDRRLVDNIVLGNGETIEGASVNPFPTLRNATLAFPTNGSCDAHNLAGGSFRDKIVLCLPLQNDNGLVYDGFGPFLAGAAGVVILSPTLDLSFTPPISGLVVTRNKFDQIMAYVNSTSNPVGTIDRTETMLDPQAPVAAYFSSPGPNRITPGILKPDLSAPGINILAAWTLLSSPTGNPSDTRKVLYNIVSGTSMACPHASGAAAYIKSFHRDWSPAMIMSALITTATPMNTPGNSCSNALKYGAGQLNPVNANDPGLVYDASESDYVAMLCAQGYNATQLALITGSNITVCANNSMAGSASDLNYPTMAAHVEPGKNFTIDFPRTVTNVGASPGAVYDLKVILYTEATNGLTVDVSPSKLEFSVEKQKVSFIVTVSGLLPEQGQVQSTTVVWYNNEHEVRSPVVVYTMDSHSRHHNIDSEELTLHIHE